MRKFRMSVLVLFFVLSLLSCAFAIEKPINQAIDSTTWKAVSLNAGQTCTSYCFQSRGGAAFKVSDTASGTNYFTIKANASLAPTEHYGVKGATIFYAQTVSGTETVEVFILKE